MPLAEQRGVMLKTMEKRKSDLSNKVVATSSPLTCKRLQAVAQQLSGPVKDKPLILHNRAIMRMKGDYIYC